MEFYIPLCREELLKQKPSSQYYVRELYDEAEIKERLKEFEEETLNEKGPLDLQECFDVFYSALRNFNELRIELRADIWNCLMRCHLLHLNEINAFLQEEINSDDRAATIDNRRDHRNTLQMNVYLLCQIAECFENQVVKTDQNNVTLTGKGKRSRKTNNVRQDIDSDWFDEWLEQKTRLLQTFVELMRQPLNLLWDPPIIDEQFVNCVGNVCYKVFENPDTGKARSNNADAIDLLGILISNYRHHSTAGIKIVQQLQHFEHLSSVWSQAVAKFVAEHHSQNVVLEIFRELANTELDDITKEGASARSYSSFLVDLVEKSPTVVLANVSLLMIHLDGECYTMRNGVLTVLTELVIKKLQGEHLGESERQNRDKFLDRLEVHLHDKNAFSRSKCMQLWTKMSEQNCIPKSRLKSLLPLVIGRLVDKGSTVRKGAIQLLTSILRNNPYMAKLSLEDMKTKFETEKEKLIQMLRKKPPSDEESQEREIIKNADLKWSKIAEDIDETISVWINSHFRDGALDSSTYFDDMLECDVMLKAIYGMLSEGQYVQACGFAVLAHHTWPDHRVFQTTVHSQDVLPASLEDMKRKLLESMKMIYLEHVVAQGLAQVKNKHDHPEVDVNEIDEEDDDEEEEDKQVDSDAPEVQQQRRLVRYLRDSKIFAEQLQTVLPQVSMMLRQTQTSDVLESIEFVVTCAEFGVNGAKAAVWKCCSLIWSKEASVKEAVVKAFQRLYLTVDDDVNGKGKYVTVALNLIDLVINSNLSQRTCLEDVVCELMKHKYIHTDVLQILWEKFAGKNAASVDESKAALKILGMAAKAEKSIVKDNFDLLIQRGLNDKSRKDFELICDTCVALEKLGQVDNRKDEAVMKQEPYRLPANSLVFTKLQNILIEGFTNVDDPLWTPMMEHSIKVIFSLSEHPDVTSGNILKSIYGILKSNQVTHCLLTRFVSLIGQSALQTFIHVDVAVCRELKRRNLIREQAKFDRDQAKFDQDEKRYRRRSVLATPRSTVSKVRGQGVQQDDEELALAGASADDVEWEYVNKLCEDDILGDETIVGKLSNFVVDICKHQQKYNNPDLQASSALALSKLMIVSSKFCETHLPLLFTLLDRSELSSVRANIIIAVGDLSFRFPNLIEPWTSTVYKRLNDRDLNVRLNCLLVLNHLILNDMIKPKGHVADIALCTLDGSPKVASLAKKFFVEYSERGNALYNLLPDIISRLSDSDTKIDCDDFKTVMKLLFSLIHKERQFESLVEKLCQRFHGTRSVEQWRFYSFCLSLPPYNDRCLKKLNENFSCFSSQLGDKEVYGNFMTIINAAKKSAKIESKTFVEELDIRFHKVHTKTSEDDEMAAKVADVKTAPESVKKPRKPRLNFPKVFEDDETLKEEAQEFAEESAKKVRKSRLNIPQTFDDDESLMEEVEVIVKEVPFSRPRRATRKGSTVS